MPQHPRRRYGDARRCHRAGAEQVDRDFSRSPQPYTHTTVGRKMKWGTLSAKDSAGDGVHS
jgi:hypothetical protein